MSVHSGRSLFLPLVFAALAACVSVYPSPATAQNAPERAERTQAPAFAETAMRSFFGDARADYFRAEGPLQAQMTSALAMPDPKGGAPRTRDIGDGLILHTGCRQRSCDESGAVVYDTETQSILVAGIIHVDCDPEAADCSRVPTLTVFTSSRHPVPLPAFVALDGWAEAKVPDIARDMQTLP